MNVLVPRRLEGQKCNIRGENTGLDHRLKTIRLAEKVRRNERGMLHGVFLADNDDLTRSDSRLCLDASINCSYPQLFLRNTRHELHWLTRLLFDKLYEWMWYCVCSRCDMCVLVHLIVTFKADIRTIALRSTTL